VVAIHRRNRRSGQIFTGTIIRGSIGNSRAVGTDRTFVVSGTTNPAAIELAREIVELFPCKTFIARFLSDDGSTGIEAALRIAAQFFQMRGEKRNCLSRFVAVTTAILRARRPWGRRRCFGRSRRLEISGSPRWFNRRIAKNFLAHRQSVSRGGGRAMIQGAAGIEFGRRELPRRCAIGAIRTARS